MVADAVAQAYPERAAAIWQQLAEARIAQTKPAAYEEAAVFLRKLRRVWTVHGKAAEWPFFFFFFFFLIETLGVLLRERG